MRPETPTQGTVTKYFHGPTEASSLLGVTRQSIHAWRKARRFPAPDVDVDGRPGWSAETLSRFREENLD